MPNEVDSLGIIAHQAADICQPHGDAANLLI